MQILASTDAPPWLPFAIVGGFLIVYPLLWCGVLLLLSRSGGWARLAKDYSAAGPGPEDRRQSLIYGRVGWVSYNKVLKLSLTPEGFFLETLAIFRPGHPRLFIPWSAVSAHRKARALFGTWVRLEIGTPCFATITLPRHSLENTPVGGET